MNLIAVIVIPFAILVAASVSAGGADEDNPEARVSPSAESRSDPELATEEESRSDSGRQASLGDPYAEERETLVERHIIGAGIRRVEVIDAMLSVPRHEFVLPAYQDVAYLDQALPIDSGQTISQPYIVAFMTEVLELDSDDRVLEVGTGSGYQAAVLAEIVADVYSIEIIDSLAATATSRLRRLGYDNITVIANDGYYGLADQAPFDAIIVTAAAGHVPPLLIEQLKTGGRMVIPIGPVYSVQVLILLEKDEDGSIVTRQILPVRFVPMTGRVQE